MSELLLFATGCMSEFWLCATCSMSELRLCATGSMSERAVCDRMYVRTLLCATSCMSEPCCVQQAVCQNLLCATSCMSEPAVCNRCCTWMGTWAGRCPRSSLLQWRSQRDCSRFCFQRRWGASFRTLWKRRLILESTTSHRMSPDHLSLLLSLFHQSHCRERESSNPNTLFSKGCSLGSFKSV